MPQIGETDLMAQPWPPGTEPGVPDADLGWVKPPGDERARVWPDLPPGDLGPPGDGGIGPAPPEPDGYPPPAAAFAYSPPAPGTGDNVTFDGSASAPGDPAAPVTGYAWLFNNQTTRSGPVVTWRLPSGSGSYDATLTVTASDGQAGQVTQVLTI